MGQRSKDMVSLADQMKLAKFRKLRKAKVRSDRRLTKSSATVPMLNIGNKDHGCPYTGKDRYSGQNAKFADRFVPDYDKRDYPGYAGRLFVLDNNKYNGKGQLKD